MNYIYIAILGTVFGMLILFFIYYRMSVEQKNRFKQQSVWLEMVFFMSPFALSGISGAGEIIIFNAALGIGLSITSLMIKEANEFSFSLSRSHSKTVTDLFAGMSDKDIDAFMRSL